MNLLGYMAQNVDVFLSEMFDILIWFWREENKK